MMKRFSEYVIKDIKAEIEFLNNNLMPVLEKIGA